jgi:3' terminal RNA ribose 2'-O-methyltransferase Hen1
MLLTIRTTHRPASDLGYLLGKNPARAQTFEMAFGKAHVFYPEVSEEACTAALLLDVDPVALVRGRPGSSGDGALDQYVNDRPYAASSFLSVAISRVLRSGLAGTSRERPGLAETAIPLEARIPSLPARGGEAFVRGLFEPLGYQVGVEPQPLERDRPEWGPSRYLTLTLSATTRLSALLSHLYVLIPVLDDQKHYFVGEEEVTKLLRHGEGWLANHPQRNLITRRYLRHRSSLVRQAIERLLEQTHPVEDEVAEARDAQEEALEEKVSLNTQRLATVLAVLRGTGATRVLDLGCGEGRLLQLLLDDRSFSEIAGMDVSHRSLEIAADRLKLERMPERQRARIRLIHGSLMYRDRRLEGFDAASVVEVIEHLDPPRLAAFERVVFRHARPGTVVVTTPNAEYNVRWESLPAGKFRHRDHRFEWTRLEFQGWASRVAERFGYTARFSPVGPEDPEVGSPTQMAVFTRAGDGGDVGSNQEAAGTEAG